MFIRDRRSSSAIYPNGQGRSIASSVNRIRFGIGNGSAFRRQLVERLIAKGAPIVAVDPDAENVRARRDYAKAGFRLTGIVELSEEQVALMIFD